MKDLFDYLNAFDSARGWDSYNLELTQKERLEKLRIQITYVLGELGELTNAVNKGLRDDVYDDANIKEEIVDIFVFLLKLSKLAQMDLEEEFYKKMRYNEERFAKFVINPPAQQG